jgi:hypothetical protein
MSPFKLLAAAGSTDGTPAPDSLPRRAARKRCQLYGWQFDELIGGKGWRIQPVGATH